MKKLTMTSLIMALATSPVALADSGFNSTAMAYVAVPLGAKTKTSFTTFGLRFGQVESAGYYDERLYSPLNDIPTLSRYMSRPALWELTSDKWGISSFKVNGLETAEREFTLNAVGAITAAASSINWGMVAAGTAATVAVAAGTSSSSGGGSSKTSTSPSSNSGGTSSNSGGGASQPASNSGNARPAPAPAPAPVAQGNDRSNDRSGNDRNDNSRDETSRNDRSNDRSGNDRNDRGGRDNDNDRGDDRG